MHRTFTAHLVIQPRFGPEALHRGTGREPPGPTNLCHYFARITAERLRHLQWNTFTDTGQRASRTTLAMSLVTLASFCSNSRSTRDTSSRAYPTITSATVASATAPPQPPSLSCKSMTSSFGATGSVLPRRKERRTYAVGRVDAEAIPTVDGVESRACGPRHAQHIAHTHSPATSSCTGAKEPRTQTGTVPEARYLSGSPSDRYLHPCPVPSLDPRPRSLSAAALRRSHLRNVHQRQQKRTRPRA